MKKINLLLILSIVTVLTACDKLLLEDERPNNPVNNFEYLWNELDISYGGFMVKNLNWDSIYQVYRPQVYDGMSNEEFYHVSTSMLRVLNDNHVTLSPTNSNLKPFCSGIRGRMNHCSFFKLSIVKTNYLAEAKSIGDDIVYGILPENIGYIHFQSFSKPKEYYRKAMDEIIEYLKDTKGIAIDIRMHEGGDDMVGKYIAGRFAIDKRLYMIVRLKNGPLRNEFTDPKYMYIETDSSACYTKPLALLTNRFSVSAAETFALAIKTLDNVTQIGDTTSGSFSDMAMKDLPNGWIFTYSLGYWNDKNDKSWEGIGCIPDFLIENDSTDIANGIDRVLEFATHKLQ